MVVVIEIAELVSVNVVESVSVETMLVETLLVVTVLCRRVVDVKVRITVPVCVHVSTSATYGIVTDATFVTSRYAKRVSTVFSVTVPRITVVVLVFEIDRMVVVMTVKLVSVVMLKVVDTRLMFWIRRMEVTVVVVSVTKTVRGSAVGRVVTVRQDGSPSWQAALGTKDALVCGMLWLVVALGILMSRSRRR